MTLIYEIFTPTPSATTGAVRECNRFKYMRTKYEVLIIGSRRNL